MARVMLEIGGTSWPVACRDGEEPEVLRLGRMLAERWAPAQRASGDAGAARVMLLIALMLADELVDLQEQAASPAPAPVPAQTTSAMDESALTQLADRLEMLATALEQPGPTS